MGFEAEGEYDENTDTWTVVFVKAGVSETLIGGSNPPVAAN